MATNSPSEEEHLKSRSAVGEAIRLGWMLLGFNGLLLMSVMIALQPRWTLGLRDGLFWLGVVATAALRYIDITRCGGQTAGGRPATMLDLRRYVVGLVASAGGVWMLAQSVNLR